MAPLSIRRMQDDVATPLRPGGRCFKCSALARTTCWCQLTSLLLLRSALLLVPSSIAFFALARMANAYLSTRFSVQMGRRASKRGTRAAKIASPSHSDFLLSFSTCPPLCFEPCGLISRREEPGIVDNVCVTAMAWKQTATCGWWCLLPYSPSVEDKTQRTSGRNGRFPQDPAYAVRCTPIPASQGSIGATGLKTELWATRAYPRDRPKIAVP